MADRLPVVALRPPAVYGPGDTAILGFFQAIRWHIKPVFAPVPQQMSIVHVTDLVSAVLLACETRAAIGQVFYIAEDRHYTLDELENLMQEALGNWAIRVRIPRRLLFSLAAVAEWIGARAGFVPRLNRDKARDFVQLNWSCSTSKAQRLLGHHSQVPFALGARQTVDWYRKKGWL